MIELERFLHQPPPPFQVYPLFLAKNFEPSQVTQFLEGPTPPPPFNKGGVPTMLVNKYVVKLA